MFKQVKIDRARKSYYDRLLNKKVYKENTIKYEDLAPYMIEVQAINNYSGINKLAQKYAQFFNDEKFRLDILRQAVQPYIKASADVQGSDGIIEVFKDFSNAVSGVSGTVDDVVEEANSYLRQVVGEYNPSNPWDDILKFPQTVYYTFIKFVHAKTKETRGPKPDIDVYRQIYQDFRQIYKILFSASGYYIKKSAKNWNSSERIARKEIRAMGDEPEDTDTRAPEPYIRDDEFEGGGREPAYEPSERDGYEAGPEVGTTYATRAPKFKGEFEPGTEELIYAMGDFWTRVKETGGGSLLAVQILQAAAEKLGRPDGLNQLFKIAASKLDEELPQ